VRISAELIQVSDQTHVWAREYDRASNDLLKLQSDVASQVADEMRGIVDRSGRAAEGAGLGSNPGSYQAHELYLKGRYFWNKRTAGGFDHAVEYFQQAIAKEPHYAPAYAGLADCYALMSEYHFREPEEFIPKARASAQQALAIDPNSAEAHTSQALIAEIYDWNWQASEIEFRRAVELDPNYATAHQWFAEHLAFRSRFDEALRESKIARRLDPLSLIIATDDAAILYYSRQYDPAIEELLSVLDMEPSFERAHALLISAYVEKQQYTNALSHIESWRATDTTFWTWAWEAYVYGRMGRQAEARRALHQVEAMKDRPLWNPDPMLAMVYAGMNQKDQAIALLEGAYRKHSSVWTILNVDHAYDPLKGDPRFDDLIRRVGLTP
jgi:tetratricopeptide (TPR) repeat protein